MILSLYEEISQALLIIERINAGMKITKNELETKLSELALMLSSIKTLRAQKKSTELDSFCHKLLSSLGIIYSLLQDTINGVEIDKLDLDDASAAGQKIRMLLNAKG